MSDNPQIKFQPDKATRLGLERIAAQYRLGTNGDSANEVMKLLASVIARVHPDKFFQVLGMIENEFCSKGNKKGFVLKRSISDHL